mgnify:CR=1 FL=1
MYGQIKKRLNRIIKNEIKNLKNNYLSFKI